MRSLRETLTTYIPTDRRLALVQGVALPDRVRGAALFTDISGFMALTEALAQELGPQRGAEELIHHLNRVFDALIAETDRYRGSVVGFHGDAMTCWFDDDGGSRAAACALAMQQAMGRFATVITPSGKATSLAMKAAVAVGAARRFLVGDPQMRLLDVLAGALLDDLAAAEGLAQKGEVLLAPSAVSALADQVHMAAWRGAAEGESRPSHGVLGGLKAPVPPAPWPEIPVHGMSEGQVRPWLTSVVYDRLTEGQGEFLAELRVAVALFLRFGGIHYDEDDGAGEKLDRFVRWVQSVLARYEGALLELTIGDKGSYLYATFGAPVAHEDDPSRAVAAALELRLPPAELGYIQPIQIGISQGSMRVGAYGGSTRRSYGVQGNEVNVAARLMTEAEAGQILATARIAKQTSAQYDLQELGALPLKGQEKPVPVFAVQGHRERRRTAVRRGRAPTPIVGREAELAVLGESLRALRDGQRGALLIEGEAGIGKSRLIVDLLDQAQALGIPALVGTGDAIERSTAYHAWRPAFRELFGLAEHAEAPAAREQVLKSLAQDSRLLDRAPLLNAVLPLGLPDNQLTAQMAGELRASNTRDLLADLLIRRTQSSPHVLVLEDAHWLDSASWALAELVRANAERLLLVIAARPMLDGQPGEGALASAASADAPVEFRKLVASPETRRLRLTALSPQAIRALVCQRLGVAELPQKVIDLILERAEGHPFFSEEIAYALRDAGILQIEAGGARLSPQAGDLRAMDFPDTIQGVITSRLDMLPAPQLLTLKVASVIGRVFPFRTLQAVHPIEAERPQLKAYVANLERLDITPLESPEPDLSHLFKHFLTQEVAYQLLLHAQRSQLHQAVAEWLERTYAGDLAPLYPVLAHHWYVAADLDPQASLPLLKAIEALEKAGEQAALNYANREALRFLSLAMGLSERRELYVEPLRLARWERSLGQAYLALGNLAESQEHLERCVSLLGQPVPATRLQLMGRYTVELTRQVLHRAWPSRFLDRRRRKDEGRFAEPFPPVNGIWRAAPGGTAAELARAYDRLSFIYYFQGDPIALLTAGLRILNVSESAGLVSRELAVAYATNSFTVGLLGLHRFAQAYRRRGLELAQNIDHLPSLTWVQVVWGNYNLGLGEWALADEAFGEVEEIARRIADHRRLEECLTLWGMAQYYQGQFDASWAQCAETYKTAAHSGDAQGKIWARFGQAGIDIARGRYAAAAEALQEGLELLKEVLDRLEEVRGYGLLARVRLYQDQPVAALQAAERTSQRIAKLLIPTGYYLLEGYAGAAEVYLRLWESGAISGMEPKEMARKARRACRALGWFARFFPIGRPFAWLWRGVFEWQRGHRKRAFRAWQKGLTHAERLRMPYAAARIHAELTRRLARGDPAREGHLARARELFAVLKVTDLTQRPETEAGLG